MSSIHEVAKAAGVSPATVSRTFSSPNLLNNQTRRRVLEVATRLDYRPRRFRTGSPKRSPRRTAAFENHDALGFLFFALDIDGSSVSDFYAPILMGAQAEAARMGLHFLVETMPRHRHADKLPKMLREEAVAGMLLVGAAPKEILEPLRGELPSVLVDNQDGLGRYDTIVSDNFGGSFRATRHLIELGHTKIGFVMNEPTAPSFRDRYHGYMSALFDEGIEPSREWIVCAQEDKPIESLLRPVLWNKSRPTAFVAANDLNAFQVMKVCRELGLVVPADLSVVGYDDIPFSTHATPALTTVRVDKELIGRLAVRCLQNRISQNIEGKAPDTPIQICVPTTLAVRESCGPPKIN